MFNLNKQPFLNSEAKTVKKNAPEQKAQLAMLKQILFDDDQIKNVLLLKAAAAASAPSESKTATETDTRKLKSIMQSIFQPAAGNRQPNTVDNCDNVSLLGGTRRQVKINMTLAPNVKDLNE